MSKYVTDFTNPFYKKDDDISQSVIIPVTNSQSFKYVTTCPAVCLSVCLSHVTVHCHCRHASQSFMSLVHLVVSVC